MNLSDLEKALSQSWARETSYVPYKWNEKNPALGQCAISALIIHDYLGGDILWSDAFLPDGQKISHYFNLIDGQEIDLTRSQFPMGTIISAGQIKTQGFATTRDFMLSNENTKRRYEILKNRTEKYLHENL